MYALTTTVTAINPATMPVRLAGIQALRLELTPSTDTVLSFSGVNKTVNRLSTQFLRRSALDHGSGAVCAQARSGRLRCQEQFQISRATFTAADRLHPGIVLKRPGNSAAHGVTSF